MLHKGDNFTTKLAHRIRSHIRKTCKIWNLYGPAEATLGSTYYLIPSTSDQPNVPIGQPFPNYRCLIVDEFSQPVILGEEGELLIGGVGVFAGYLGRDDLTKNVLLNIDDDLFYKTGDIVRLDSHRRLHYLRRKDHQIKLRGQRIELGEIEGCILGASSFVTACVVILWSKEYLVAYVQSDSTNAKLLRESCEARLPLFMVPSLFIVLAQLPLNPNGKVDRKRLPSPDFFGLLAQTEVANDRPTNEIEEEVHGLWCKVLGQDTGHISISVSFYSIGGHSLLLVQLYHRYQLLFDFDTSASTIAPFLRQTTIAEHAKIIGTIKSFDRKTKRWQSFNVNTGMTNNLNFLPEKY
ncbi:unnamed protein product [Rotaria magnacalcarata]|uniref:Carrier domain-containing protein n=1 Tax=Rotaria magnacalcarata TaxID=392030 RepID=A0A815UT99_9BILA|nr:unnamed protein product [Rotaria magnacalcarata]